MRFEAASLRSCAHSLATRGPKQWKQCSLERVQSSPPGRRPWSEPFFCSQRALGVVAQLKDAMNTIWNVPESKDAGIWWYVRTYLISLAGILGLGFLLAVSLIISAAIAALSGTSANAMMGELINFVASLAILSVLFGMLFKWFPDADVDWQDVIPGAVATALLFNIGKFAIGWYVGTQGLESTYGAAASIVILLIWVYYSAQIVLFGAELTHAYAITRRSGKSGSQITSAKR